MQLDFPTLYVVIFLNSLSLIVVWAAIAWVYTFFRAARFWLASLLMTCAGGILLALDGSGPASASTMLGIVSITAGFGVMWQGVRVFYGKRPLWRVLALMVAASAAAVALAGNERAQQNVVYAGVQMIPVALATLTLLRAHARQLGTLVAACAACITLAGHAGEVFANIARLMGMMSTEVYYDYAGWFLIAAIIGGSVLNLAFLLMAIDRLRSEMAALAEKDDLTGLPNRRGFRHAMSHGSRTGAAVLMFDLDGFKTINDRHGHAAGDACLVHIASVAGSIQRRSDVLARLSGDEFCLLLPNTDLCGAEKIAARLAEVIASTPFVWKGQEISLTISMGVSEWRPDSQNDISQALEEADTALYKTKRRGRNGYTIYRAAPPENDRPALAS